MKGNLVIFLIVFLIFIILFGAGVGIYIARKRMIRGPGTTTIGIETTTVTSSSSATGS